MNEGNLLYISTAKDMMTFSKAYPVKDLYFTGDMSQIAKPSAPIRLVMQLAMQKG
jgi:hypothetical protein